MKTVSRNRPLAAFTIIEIAISIAVIAFALVAIIGVLPMGLGVQRENREETIINQDAAVFISAIRNGARGLDDLTNYVLAITIKKTNSFGLDTTTTYVNPRNPPPPSFALPNQTNFLWYGSNIVGLLGTWKYEGNETNQVVAYVRAISGPASDKPPQNNTNVLADAFAYQMVCENLPVPSNDGNTPYGNRLTNNLRDLRLTFRWPLLPSGQVPDRGGRQTFRTQIGGRVWQANDNGPTLYFFEPQTFAQPNP